MADEEEYYEEEVIEDDEEGEWEEEIIEEYVDEDGNIVEVAPGEEEVLVEELAETTISQPVQSAHERAPDVPYQAPAKPSLPAPVGKPVAPTLKVVPAAEKPENLSQAEINRRKDEAAQQARRAKSREEELARTKANQEAKAAREAASGGSGTAAEAPAKKGGFFGRFGKKKEAEPAKTVTVPFSGKSKPVVSAAASAPAPAPAQPKTMTVPFSGKSKPVTAADQSAPPPGTVRADGKIAAGSAGVSAAKAQLANSGLATTVKTRRKQKTAKIVTETREKFSKKTGEITRTTIRYITEPDGTKRTETTTETIKKG